MGYRLSLVAASFALSTACDGVVVSPEEVQGDGVGTESSSDAGSHGNGRDSAGTEPPDGPGMGGTSGGGNADGAAGGGENGGPSDDAASAGGDGGYDYWPNPRAPANSDPWLRDHHDEIKVMRPRVLVLDVQRVGRPIEAVISKVIDALAEGSRYHGYSDPDAPAFLQYEVEKIVDLRDPVAEYPSFWPPGPNFDVGQLYTEGFAPRYGFADPDRPDQYLALCELFERGIIHELWIAAEAGVRAVYENQSRMQRYDEDFNKIPGSFQDCTNGCYNDPGRLVNCKVTTRMQEVNKGRGPGCFSHAAGHALENMGDAMPYLRINASRFFYFGLRDGENGQDLTTLYSQPGSLADEKMAEYERRFPDCDGGWNTYMRQSMPGLGSAAFAEDGSPMKNWWPFLFY